MKKNNDIILLLIALVVAFYFFKEIKTTFKNLFGGIGIGSTTEDDQREEAIQTATEKVSDFFDINYWNKPNSKLFTMSAVTQMCKDLYDAIGYIYDTPEQVISVFNQCKYKTQVSWLSYQFNKIYKKDLFSWLNSKMDTDEQRSAWLTILKRINSLPKGY